MQNKNKKGFIQKSNGGNETSIDNNGKEQRSKKAGRNLSTPCCVAVGLHALAAEDYLWKKEPNGRRCCLRTKVLYVRLFHGIMAPCGFRLRIGFAWGVVVVCRFSAVVEKEPRHCGCAVADDLSISSCTSAGAEKKVTLEWPSIILTLCEEMESRLIVFGSALLITAHSDE
jgi:hypothetical protein